MEKIEKLPVFGYGGNTYFFKVYPLRGGYPEAGGVYIFAKKVPAPNPVYTVIYIGHAESFNRITVNGKFDCVQSNGANTICLMPVETETDRIAIVRELEERLRPECNADAKS